MLRFKSPHGLLGILTCPMLGYTALMPTLVLNWSQSKRRGRKGEGLQGGQSTPSLMNLSQIPLGHLVSEVSQRHQSQRFSTPIHGCQGSNLGLSVCRLCAPPLSWECFFSSVKRQPRRHLFLLCVCSLHSIKLVFPDMHICLNYCFLFSSLGE